MSTHSSHLEKDEKNIQFYLLTSTSQNSKQICAFVSKMFFIGARKLKHKDLCMTQHRNVKQTHYLAHLKMRAGTSKMQKRF
jgi:hypothetical protein